MTSRLTRLQPLLAMLIPLSLLVGSTKIISQPIPLYLPEVVAVLYFATAAYLYPKKLLHVFEQLPPIIRLAGTLICIGVVSGVVFAPDMIDALGAAKSWFFFPLLFVWGYLASDGRVTTLLSGLFAFGLIETGLGLIEFFGGEGGRLAGTFLSPNMYAAAVAPLFVLSVYLALKQPRMWFVALILLVGLLFSQSLGGFIGAAGGLLVVSLVHGRGVYRWGITVLLAVMLLVGGMIGKERFQEVANSSAGSRIQIWHASFALLKISPITGTGLRGFDDQYGEVIPTLYPTPLEWSVPEPHNIFAAFWLDLGLFGFVGMLGLIGAIVTGALGQFIALPFIVILLHGLVDTPFFQLELAFIFWIYVSLAIKERYLRSSNEKS